MNKFGSIAAVALLLLTGAATAQANAKFANRTPIFPNGGNGPVNVTTRFTTSQQVENDLACTSPRSAPNPTTPYTYNGWYSFVAAENGYLEVRPQVWHDAILYFGSSLSGLNGPLDKFGYGSVSAQYIRVSPGQEIIYRNCRGYNSVPAVITDATATIRFLPGLEADLSTAALIDRETYQFKGFYARAQVSNLTASRPSGSFALTVNLESDRGFSIRPSELGNGGTNIIGSDTYQGTGLNPTVSPVTCQDGKCRMTITFPKSAFSIPTAGLSSDGVYAVAIPVVSASDNFKMTASISQLENPDPNSANNSAAASYVPPPPPPASGPIGAGANVPTATEWQLMIFGALLFVAAVYGAARGSRQS